LTISLVYGDSPNWYFGDDGLITNYLIPKSGYYWDLNEACLCTVSSGGCSYSLNAYQTGTSDSIWTVKSGEWFSAGQPLALNDTTLFANENGEDLDNRDPVYKFDSKNNTDNDTAYFVYKNGSSYYALCQYIAVYDSILVRDVFARGIPSHYVHSCAYQDDGTPTFSALPAFEGKLPESKSKTESPWAGFATKPVRIKESPVGAQHQVNGARSEGTRASHVNVQPGKAVRKLR